MDLDGSIRPLAADEGVPEVIHGEELWLMPSSQPQHFLGALGEASEEVGQVVLRKMIGGHGTGLLIDAGLDVLWKQVA